MPDVWGESVEVCLSYVWSLWEKKWKVVHHWVYLGVLDLGAAGDLDREGERLDPFDEGGLPLY